MSEVGCQRSEKERGHPGEIEKKKAFHRIKKSEKERGQKSGKDRGRRSPR
jgi:hypothetical protein